MARKPTRFAGPAIAVLTVVSWSQNVPFAHSQDAVRVSQQPAVIQNPYASDVPLPVTVPDEPTPPRRGPTAYHNPFASTPARPPIDLPLRPGPLSRWQRSGTLPVLPSPVASATLSTAPQPTAGNLAIDPIGRAAIDWDRLPPVDEMRARRVERAVTIDVTADPVSAYRTDPVQFAPALPAQPDSLLPEAIASTGTRAFDPFEIPSVSASNGSSGTATIPQNGNATVARQTLGAGQPPGGRRPRIDLISAMASDAIDSPEGWYAQAERTAQSAQSFDDFTAVVEFCERGLRGGPSPELTAPLRRLAAWAYNRRGEALVDAGRQREALADFQMAIGLDANCSLAIHNRGVTLAQQNKPADALRDFNRVIELNPGLAIAYRNRAELLSSLDRMDEAVRDFDRAIEQLSDNAELYRARAYAWQRLGEYDRALADLNQSLRLSPTDAATYAQRGNLAAERGDFGQAIRDFQRALDNDAKSVEAYRGLAWLLATCPDPQYGDGPQALAAAKKGAELTAPDDYYMADALAAALARTGQYDEAVRVAGHAISVSPPEVAVALQGRLKLYQQGQAYQSRPSSTVRTARHEEPR